jgi:hypothetical protein
MTAACRKFPLFYYVQIYLNHEAGLSECTSGDGLLGSEPLYPGTTGLM